MALTPQGEEQARAAVIPPVARVLVSDLQRAKNTARLACPHDVTHVLPELRERRMGILQGQRIAEVRTDGRMERWLHPFDLGPPGGESHHDVLKRALAALRHWDDGRPTLVVAHGTLVKDLVAWIDGVPPDEIGTLPSAPNAQPVTRFVRWGDVRRV